MKARVLEAGHLVTRDPEPIFRRCTVTLAVDEEERADGDPAASVRIVEGGGVIELDDLYLLNARQFIAAAVELSADLGEPLVPVKAADG